MHLSNKLSCEAGSFSCCHNPHRFLQPEVLRLYFPVLEPWVTQCVSLPSSSSQFIHTQMSDHPVCHFACLVLQWPPCRVLFTPSTSLDECFFFNSLVVGLPYSSISQQFWLFFVFKFVVVLLLVVRDEIVYLPMPLPWPEVFLQISFLCCSPDLFL